MNDLIKKSAFLLAIIMNILKVIFGIVKQKYFVEPNKFKFHIKSCFSRIREKYGSSDSTGNKSNEKFLSYYFQNS